MLKEPLQHMWKLAPLRAQVRAGEYIIAQDVQCSSKVVKRFFKGTLEELRTLKNKMDRKDPLLPPWNREFCWYEVIDETKPARIFIDIETVHGEYDTVRQGVEQMISMFKMVYGDEYLWHVADASNASKISFHVVGGPLLHNLYHVGAAVRRFSLWAHENRESCAGLFDNTGAFVVDEAIYTKGRQFRLFGAHKMGSDRVLMSSTPWWEALVNVPGVSMEQLEIDGSAPVSTSSPAKVLFREVNGSYQRVSTIHTVRNHMTYGIPTFLAEVVRWLYRYDPKIQTYELAFNSHYKTWRMPSRSTRCQIAGRKHKSNHVWYTIDAMSQTIHQRCLDEDCAGQVHVLSGCTEWDERLHAVCPYVAQQNSSIVKQQLGLTYGDFLRVQKENGVYIIHSTRPSKAFRPNLIVWKQMPENIVLPCEIAIFFTSDKVYVSLGTLNSWAGDILRVKDFGPQSPEPFYRIVGKITQNQPVPNVVLNSQQREMLTYLSTHES